MIKASVIGGTGYAGQELLRILYRHPEVEVVSVGSRSFAGQPLKDIYRNYENVTDALCETADMDELVEKSDVIFMALPHGIASKQVTEDVLKKQRSLISAQTSVSRTWIFMKNGTKSTIIIKRC